jgi:hypothetical protein
MIMTMRVDSTSGREVRIRVSGYRSKRWPYRAAIPRFQKEAAKLIDHSCPITDA